MAEMLMFHGAPVIADEDLCEDCYRGKPLVTGGYPWTCPKCGERWILSSPELWNGTAG